MYITLDTIIEIGKVIGALGVIGGFLVAIYKILKAPKEQAEEIKDLKETHDSDIKEIQKELCVTNYAVLAALDALRQQGYNGEVTNAHDKLLKHLNQQAHNQP